MRRSTLLRSDLTLAGLSALPRGHEGNWIAYNDGADVALPGSGQPPLAFLVYPQAENDGIACVCLDPSTATYAITAQTLTP